MGSSIMAQKYTIGDAPPQSKYTIGDAPAPAAGTAPQEPSMLSKGLQMAGDVYTGATQGLEHTLGGLGNLITRPFVSPEFAQRQKSYLAATTTPQNTPQKIGYGAEQIGEFLAPGGAEKKAISLAPRVIRPLAEIAIPALSSGAINKAQGGDFTTGALAGGAGAGIGAGLRKAAPIVAETALGIPKAARAFGKTPGRAILEETRGIRPETIAESARGRLGELNPELERLANEASTRPNPARALLPAPVEEIPLAPYPSPRNPRTRPMTFNAEIKSEEPMEPRSGNPMADISEYPGINPHYLSGSEHPELSGRITPLQRPQQVTTRMGVLLRRPEVEAGAIPALPNRTASLEPGRAILREAAGQAERENAAGLHGQIGRMQDFLTRRFGTGKEIPAEVTPRELLDLKRGLSEEHLGWNPETHKRALSAGRRAYGALDRELDRVIPQAAGINQRISSLIPVAQRAESISRNAPTLQRALGRFGAHTGALTLGGIGAAGGYREGGLPGAVAGGLTGVLAPELIASPEGQMAIARSLRAARGLRPAVGLGLQLNRERNQQ